MSKRSLHQDMQCTYYVTSRRVRSLSYPACKAHAPYCQLWPATTFFNTISQKGTIFLKKSY